MIKIGIDPEPSGAFCIWDDVNDSLIFSTSYPDLEQRAQNFLSKLYTFTPGRSLLTVYIEDVGVRPYQNIKASLKYFVSFGAWLGMLELLDARNDFEIAIHKIPAAKWKKFLNLSSDKLESYYLVMNILKNTGEYGNENTTFDKKVLKQLKLAPDIPEKQIFDRCEAFLLAYYGEAIIK